MVAARQSTPVATPGPDEIAAFVQFFHFEKSLTPFGIALSDEQQAGLYGLDVATYRGILQHFATAARGAAEELLTDEAFAARVDRLPFAAGQTVVGVGDSLTDDLQSWLEILRHLLELRRPGDRIQIVNRGISGATTTDALMGIIPTLTTRPDWICCLLGTNDAIRYGRQATKTLVSPEETARNLLELRDLAAAESEASWVWLTPPTCDEAVIAASPFYAAAEMQLRNDDLITIADAIRRQPEPVVDLVALFGRPPAAELLLADGLHPSLAGQQAIARALVERLTA
jgi:lysophospholipase L1-like esterase